MGEEMRRHLLAGLLAAMPAPAPAHCLHLHWADAEIPVPPLVQSFIETECRTGEGRIEADAAACVKAERYGYRAVVTMLADATIGEEAADRYRACRGGLGDFGGRFHRRRAECMGASFGYCWRFEFTREATLGPPQRTTDFAHYATEAGGRAF